MTVVPTITANRIALEREPTASIQFVLRVELNYPPRDDMRYWALREDQEENYRGQWYPQFLAEPITNQPLLKFLVQMPLADQRGYKLVVVECDLNGDAEIWKVVHQGPDVWLSGPPVGCRPVGDALFKPLK